MGLITDYQRVNAGQRLNAWQARFVAAEAELEGIFNNLEALAVEYAADAAEINGKITQGKTLLQALIDRH